MNLEKYDKNNKFFKVKKNQCLDLISIHSRDVLPIFIYAKILLNAHIFGKFESCFTSCWLYQCINLYCFFVSPTLCVC